MRFQPIYDIAEVCARKGLKQAVLCPGSRCAPLTLAFARHPDITTRTFSDERSAAFVALGMSQQLNTPTVLICTSGSAVYNLAPAVAEALFSQVPLVVLTADRPAEWIHQHDGQTIYQSGIFGAHVKQSFQLPQNYDHPDDQWMINRVLNDAINLSTQEPKGPVHINIPLREPLYPEKGAEITFSKNVRIIVEEIATREPSKSLHDKLIKEFNGHSRTLIVAGQGNYDKELIDSINSFTTQFNIPIIGEITSNLHPLKNLIKHADLFVGEISDELKKELQPDLLITIGKSVLSKNLKLFIRKFYPTAHWHISPGGTAVDPFQHLTKIIRLTPQRFFNSLKNELQVTSVSEPKKNYCKGWGLEEKKSLQVTKNYFQSDNGWGELKMVQEILQNLPEKSSLHLANSMSVRYANFIGLEAQQKDIRVYCNRGTSGIDGCTSTAAGHALTSDETNVLITGDLAFFYDRNAFWHNYRLPNLRIVVLNNHGGVIFKMIDGPKELPEADEYFVTHQKLTAQKLCEEFDFTYMKCGDRSSLNSTLKDFFHLDGSTKILELETSVMDSKKIYDNFKQAIKKNYEL